MTASGFTGHTFRQLVVRQPVKKGGFGIRSFVQLRLAPQLSSHMRARRCRWRGDSVLTGWGRNWMEFLLSLQLELGRPHKWRYKDSDSGSGAV